MMLHALDIMFHLTFWNAHGPEEVSEDAMAASDGTCNRLPLRREDQTAVLFMPNTSLGI